MIICQIITTLVYGGAERLLVNFSNILVDRHELHIIYLKGEPKFKPHLNEKINVHFIPLGWDCARDIRRLIRKLNPDVVHTHLGHADLIGMWACRGLGVRLFCTMHNVYFKWNWIDKIIFFIYFISFKTYAKRCKVSCISNAVAKHVKNTLGVNERNIYINFNAIPDIRQIASKSQLRAELGIRNLDFILLTVGRLRIQKSQETLLKSIPLIVDKIDNLKVLIVGEGELKESLQSLSRDLDIEEVVEFVGGTNYPEKYLAACDVFILTSVFEGLPTVILEAFRSSVPVIASNIDGTNMLIKDGENGLLFKSKDYSELASCVLKLYYSPQLREKFGKEGHAAYQSNFNISVYAKEMESLYSS